MQCGYSLVAKTPFRRYFKPRIGSAAASYLLADSTGSVDGLLAGFLRSEKATSLSITYVIPPTRLTAHQLSTLGCGKVRTIYSAVYLC
jgi:hypothetical protein